MFGALFVGVTLKNGEHEKRYRALLGTGSMASYIRPAVAVDLHLDFSSTETIKTISYQGWEITSSLVVVDICFSKNLSFKQHKVAITDIAPIRMDCGNKVEEAPVNVIIGMDIIGQCDFFINGSAHEFMIQKTGEKHYNTKANL